MKQHAVRAGKKAEVMVLSTFVLANHGCKRVETNNKTL
jgi:hypothetical protein